MKINEYAQMMGWLTRPARQEPRFMAQGGRIGFKRGTQPLPKNIRLTPEGQYRFSTQVGEGFSKSFPKGTKIEDVKKFRDDYLKDFGIEEGQLRKKTTEGPFKNVKGEKHIKFNGKTYQVNVQRMKDGKNISKPVYVDNLSEAKKLRNLEVKKTPPKWTKGVFNPDREKQQIKVEKRRAQQKTQEGRLIRYKAPKGYQVHHIMPLAGYRDMTNQDIAVVSAKMNKEMAQFDKPINKLVNEAENLDFNKTKSLSRLQEINEELADIVKNAEKKLGPKYKGLLGFNKLTPVLDTFDDKGRQVFHAQPVGINYKKTVGGKFKKATKIRDMPTKEVLKQVSFAPLVNLGCPGKAAGGRINFDIGGSTACITRGLEKLKNPTNLSPGDQANIRALKEMGKGAKGARTFGQMARLLGKVGIGGELAFGGLFALTDYAGGSNKQEILSNFTYGLAGKSMDEQLKEKDELYGRPKEIISGFTSLQDMLKREETQPIGRMSLKPGAIDQQITVVKEKIQPFMRGPRNEEFEYDLFAQQQAKDAQALIDFENEKLKTKAERQGKGILAADDWYMNVDKGRARGYAEGGIASLKKKW